jgi:hypothetical protein
MASKQVLTPREQMLAEERGEPEPKASKRAYSRKTDDELEESRGIGSAKRELKRRELAILEALIPTLWSDDEPPVRDIGGAYCSVKPEELRSTALLTRARERVPGSEFRVTRKHFDGMGGRNNHGPVSTYAHVGIVFHAPVQNRSFRSRGTVIEPSELRPTAKALNDLADELGIPADPQPAGWDFNNTKE